MTAKIALFIPSLMPGGVQRVMLNLSHGLIEHGYRVDMVLVKAHGLLLGQVPQGVRVVDLNATSVLASLPALWRYLRREKPAAVLSAQPHCNLAAIWARMLSGTHPRLVVSEHNTLSNSLSHTHQNKDKLFPRLMRIFYPAADAIVAVSKGVAEDVRNATGLPGDKFHVIYNPIVFLGLESMAAAPLEHPWFAKGQPPVILNAGRLAAQKDQATLINAFALLRARRSARLVLLGEGEKRAELEALAAQLGITESTAFLGFDENPFKYMARCAVFVLSSRWEGFGNVLVEAMTCGAQVVSTDCPSGPAEILENGKFGRLAPPGDAAALAAAIESALDNPLPVKLIRARADAFSIEAATEKYLRLLTGERDG
jgi:glycosyltransferase involved in cell wall biosynthesis